MADNQSSRIIKTNRRIQATLRTHVDRARRALVDLLNPSPVTPHSVPSGPSSLIIQTHSSSRLATSSSRTFHRFKNTAWNGLEAVLHTLETSAGVFPAFSSAVAHVISCLDVVEAAATDLDCYYELATGLATTANAVRQYITELEVGSKEGVPDCLSQISKSIEAEASYIRKKQGRSKRARLFMPTRDREDTIRHYRRIKTLFIQLQNDITLRVLRNTTSTNNQTLMLLLRNMSPVDDARYSSSYSTFIKRRACTANTREIVQGGIQRWVQGPNATRVYWINGMAGTGKTTIAFSLCKWLEDRNQLGASFFCSRSSPSCRDVNRILPTVSYQLAGYLPGFRAALCDILERNPDASKLSVVQQFEKLVQVPLQQMGPVPASIVIVIDALDECEDGDGARILLERALCISTDLPVKFLITSRPEPTIRNTMIFTGRHSTSVLHLHDIDKPIVEADIRKYLEEELGPMSPPASRSQIEQLAHQAEGLFIYAATIVRYVLPGNAQVDSGIRFTRILGINADSKPGSYKCYKELDLLYSTILSAAFNYDVLEDEELETIRLVLQTAVCAKEPMRVKMLAELLDRTERQVSMGLEPLLSVLHVSQSDELVSTLHASFSDYIFDSSRSAKFYCDAAQHNELLTLRCFAMMKKQLRFNICDLKSSFVFDKDIVDLDQRVDVSIGAALLYSCRYWGAHLHQSGNSEKLTHEVLGFLTHRFLFWMEVLNLTQHIVEGITILTQVEDWLLVAGASSGDVQKQAADSRDFLVRFAASACTRSTPHIYISALPFSSKSGLVYMRYWERTQGLVNVKGTALRQREKAAQATWMFSSPVMSVAFSSDGRKVGALLRKKDLLVKDAYTGDLFFTLSGNSISSFAFSPDGTRILVGNDNNSIEEYYARTGLAIPGSRRLHGTLLEGKEGNQVPLDKQCLAQAPEHFGDNSANVADTGSALERRRSINSVMFSPNGCYTASSSSDGTVRLWDARTGQGISELLTGRGSMRATAFSPNSTILAYGSDSRFMSLWNVRTRAIARVIDVGSKGTINTLAFSPDGTLIACGFSDHVIRVWDSSSGIMYAGPFTGHTSSINTLVFHPDGLRIISGSNDRTIRAWDIGSGRSVAEPFEGHTDAVYSVALSPDGNRIISGSRDRTVRVWDAQLLNNTGALLSGHTDLIYAVAFSPDGTRIASGSRDRTVRVWDANTGGSVIEPLQGHVDSVYSVKFSPAGTTIASGSRDGTVHVWDIHTGCLITKLSGSVGSSVTSVSFSPDSSCIVASSGAHTILVWNLHTNDAVTKPFKAPGHPLNSVGFSPDGGHIISASCVGEVYVWSIHTGSLVAGPFRADRGAGLSQLSLHSLPSFRSFRSLMLPSLSPRPTDLPQAILPQIPTAQEALSLNALPSITPPSPDAFFGFRTTPPHFLTRAVSRTSSNGSGCSSASVHSARSLRSAYSLSFALPLDDIPQWACSPVSELTHNPLLIEDPPVPTLLQSDTPSLMSRIGRMTRSLRSTRSVRSLRSISSINACIAVFSPNGQRVVHISDQLFIQVWDSYTGKTILGPLGGAEGQAWSLALSSDGTLVVTGMHDNTVRIWDGCTGSPTTGPFRGHVGPINSIAFSLDGSRIVSGSSDRTIRVWNPYSGNHEPAATNVTPAGSSDTSKDVRTTQETKQVQTENVGNPFLGTETLKFHEDGWITTRTDGPVLWVSPDLHEHIPHPHNPLVIGPQGSVYIDYEGFDKRMDVNRIKEITMEFNP